MGKNREHACPFCRRKTAAGAQVVVAFAVTRDGIPVRCWVSPGNTADQSVVEEVKRDLNGWKLGRVVLVQDTGFNSEASRRILQGAGGHYIIGEKMRLGRDGTPAEALTRGGKYHRLENGLEVKEVIVGGDSEARRRFIIVRNVSCVAIPYSAGVISSYPRPRERWYSYNGF